MKIKIWDEKYRQWDTGPLMVYPGEDIKKQGRMIILFTGFLDKNGKEIYEGDIFKGREYKWDPVEFMYGKFQVNLKGAGIYSLDELFEDNKCPEVIGNIFENPELLKL